MAKPIVSDFGTEPIGKLLVRQAVSASIGILVMSLNILIDTIFVGHWIGAQAIAAINVVLPVSFRAALGMSIEVGGSSIISRALGSKSKSKALKTFSDKITYAYFNAYVYIFWPIFIDEIIGFGGRRYL